MQKKDELSCYTFTLHCVERDRPQETLAIKLDYDYLQELFFIAETDLPQFFRYAHAFFTTQHNGEVCFSANKIEPTGNYLIQKIDVALPPGWSKTVSIQDHIECYFGGYSLEFRENWAQFIP